MVLSNIQAREFEASINAGLINLGISDAWVTGPALGLTLSTPVKSNITGEAELFYYFSPAKGLGLVGAEITSSGINLNISCLYHFKLGNNKIKPYAALGLGIFLFHSKWNWAGFGDTLSNTWLDIIFGGGAKWSLDKHSGLRLDLRYVIIPKADGDFLRATAGYYRAI